MVCFPKIVGLKTYDSLDERGTFNTKHTVKYGRHDTQHNNTQHKGLIRDNEHNDTQHNDTQQNKIKVASIYNKFANSFCKYHLTFLNN